MQLPARIPEIIDAFTAQPQYLALAKGSDDDRRRLVRLIGEQCRFELGPRWGNKKRAGVSDDARSKDSIAYLEDDGTCSVWDWQNGSARERQINAGDGPTYPHLSTAEATCMPLESFDRLGAEPAAGGEPSPGTPTGGAFASFDQDVRAAHGREEQSLTRIEAMLGELLARPVGVSVSTPAAPVAPAPAPMPAAPAIEMPAGLDIGSLSKFVRLGLLELLRER